VEGEAARSNVVDELELRAGDEHAETRSFHGSSGSFLSCEEIVVKKAGTSKIDAQRRDVSDLHHTWLPKSSF
jgi:hypothetical protein